MERALTSSAKTRFNWWSRAHWPWKQSTLNRPSRLNRKAVNLNVCLSLQKQWRKQLLRQVLYWRDFFLWTRVKMDTPNCGGLKLSADFYKEDRRRKNWTERKPQNHRLSEGCCLAGWIMGWRRNYTAKRTFLTTCWRGRKSYEQSLWKESAVFDRLLDVLFYLFVFA